MERLAALAPPPRKNQMLYHGVLASRAAWRQQIVPQPQRSRGSDHEHTRAIIRPERASRRSRWMLWSTLLKRVFEVDGFVVGLGSEWKLKHEKAPRTLRSEGQMVLPTGVSPGIVVASRQRFKKKPPSRSATS